MRRLAVPVLVVLAGLVALGAPAVPALTRYGALPRVAGRPVTVLLAGVTPRYQENAAVWPWPVAPEDFTFLTDTLVLAQLWPGGRANLLSIPRDTWVNLAGHGWGKINGANVKGGPDLLVKAVQDLTGVPVDAYVLLSLNAVRALTDAAGGVTLDVPRRMKYDDNAGKLHIDLQPGRQRLSGQQAEGFLRFRKDNLGDLGRVQRQQLYLTALVNRVRTPLNWWRLPAMVGALDRNTRTNLTRAQVGALLGAALGGVQVNTATLPGSFGDGGTWVADHPALHALVRERFRDPNDPRFLTVAVVNVGAPEGSARRLRARLERLGYQQLVISNGPRAGGPTTVSGKAAAAVQRDVGYGRVTREEDLPGADVTVRLGSDTKEP